MAMKPHFLIVGLGNLPLPRTRHSIGHYILDSLAFRCGAKLVEDDKLGGLIGQCDTSLNNRPTQLSFFKSSAEFSMNVQGKSIARAARSTIAHPSSLIIIQDSLHFPPGVLRTKYGGSPSGHRGIRSVSKFMNLTGDTAYHRLLAGIGRSGTAADFVLGPLSAFEKEFWASDGDGIDMVWQEIERIARRTHMEQSEAKAEVVEAAS